MASSYSSRIRLEKQGTGENANTWGQRLNGNVIDLVDAAVAGVTAVDVDGQGGSGVTLTTNNGSSDQARSFGLRMTGALSADVTVSYAAAPEKIYFVNNETTGGHNVIMDNGSTKVTVGNGPALVATNGSNSYVLKDFDPGTRLAFNQDTAPSGWTVITSASHAGAALRIVNAATSGAQVGGSNEFTSVFNSSTTINVTGATNNATLSGSTSATALTTAQIPSHKHAQGVSFASGLSPSQGWTTRFGSDNNTGVFTRSTQYGSPPTNDDYPFTSNIGSGSGHSHSLVGKGEHYHTGVSASGSFNLNVKYVNFIVCQKD